MSESLFQQAFDEIRQDIEDLATSGDAERWRVLERLRTPDRIIRFAVRWMDDDGKVQVNTAWRVQHCNALGPYKGGLRFDPAVNEDTLSFLAFEQCFKNALTGLPMGGGKGGADFSPKKRSNAEIMRFCQAFMDEYVRYGGPDQDVPAGDIGVGSREVGFLFGRYLKLTGQHVGVLTGKPELLGGIAGREEATGFGAVRFAALMLEEQDDSLEGKSVAISGSGNVALFAARRCVDEGARVVTLSERAGALFHKDGLSANDLDALEDAKDAGDSLEGVVSNAEYKAGANPWSAEADIAIPCATQNEIDEDDAKQLADNGVNLIIEGANMPCTDGAIRVFNEKNIARAPGKAANAGGVAVSGLEMSQNASRYPWTRERTLEKLDEIMGDIHDACAKEGRTNESAIDYARGANRAAFKRLSKAMVAMGVV